MAKSVIAKELSKQYRIGRMQHETMLREAVLGFIKHPFRRIKSTKQTIWALRDVSFEPTRCLS